MTTIEARQRIAELLAIQDEQAKKINSVIALNSARVNRHITIIKKMWSGHWNADVADDYLKIFESRVMSNY